MSTATSTAWPPRQGLGTPTVSRRDAVLTTTGQIKINAPAAKVLETLLDAEHYGDWNTWIPEVKILSQPEGVSESEQRLHVGTHFVFQVIMDASKPNNVTATELRVSDISTPEKVSTYLDQDFLEKEPGFTSAVDKIYRVAWKSEGRFVSLGLRSERFHEVIPLGENECEVRTWEIMGGYLAYTVRWMFSKTLDQKFVLWCEDLKKHCEKS